MTTIKYVAINTNNNEPLYESESYLFLVKMIQKVTAKKTNTPPIKIYKKIITEEVKEM